MEYKEAPCIQNVDRNLAFPFISWLTKARFLEYLQTNRPIYPYLMPNEESAASLPSNMIRRTFIGKSIQSNLSEGVRYGYDYKLLQKEINLEMIGSVMQTLNGQWELQVPHSSNVFKIQKDFLVLCIDDPNSFEWVSTQKSNIPKYALRACIDRLTNEYFYVGRVHHHFNCPVPECFQGATTWTKFNEPLPVRFGKVHVTHKAMYVPFNNLELAFSCYDTLCLKPSPSSLRILCRLRVRTLLDFSSEKIKKINVNKSGRKYVPESVLKFINYPSYLSVGEYMLKGEKVIRSDGKFFMEIESNGNLTISSIITDKDTLSDEELQQRQLTQVKNILSSDVDSIWLHRFQVAFFKTNTKVKVMHSFFDTSPEYKLFINDDNPADIAVEEIKK